MAQIIRTYLIAPTLLDDVMNGVEMDLEITRFPDFALLKQYCYGVASAVGLVSLEIFGCRIRARATTPSRSGWRCS